MSNLVRIEFPDSSALRPSIIEYEGSGTNLRELILSLAEESSFLGKLIDDKGELHSLFRFYVNEEDVRYLQKLDTPIKDGDEIFIITALVGG